ncbi:hypothetical protein [Microlunatus speluncae]|uniref:hypothetical protein n=1 Tax=Microlunatus speluncae TaxID=2594267 RepID=UPI0012664238|nr:hypothetical protein [Microlunatus speluncae]
MLRAWAGELAEAALLDVRLDATTSELWLLFDCRGALQIAEANTAVIAVNGVTAFSWEAEPRHSRTWRVVTGCGSRGWLQASWSW